MRTPIRKFAAILALVLATNIGVVSAASMEKIRHLFLLASAGDIRLQKKAKIAQKKLGKCGEDAVPFLISQLKRKNIRKVLTAERALRAIGEDAVPYLIMALADTNKTVASLSARILGQIGDKRALPALMVAARYGFPGLRASACYALGNFQDSAVVSVLIDALKDTVPAVRRYAALSLMKLGTRRAIKPLFELLADSSYGVRYTAERALAKIDTDTLFALALARLDSAQPPEKYHIISLIGAVRSDSALAVIGKLLQDQNYFVRGFACEALGYFRGNWRAANMLKRALWDNSEFVRMKARSALEKMKQYSLR